MARIKICGMMRQQDIGFVNELKPDFVGFILTKGFRRSIEMDTALVLKSLLDKGIKSVGVFVDEDINLVNDYIERGVVDIVQLHGNEDVDYCKAVSKPVIKMLKPSQFDMVADYEPYVDYFLFDSGTGTGKVFDWSTLPATGKPFFLAGGLDKDNLAQAVKNVQPYAVDMSSSVETDGYKDYDKIKEVISIVRDTK